MKNKLTISLILIIAASALVFNYSKAIQITPEELQILTQGQEILSGATILFPSGGGLGTSTAPTAGQLLTGKANRTYDLLATSTDGSVLWLDTNGYPAWIATSSLGLTGLTNPMTAAGDLIYGGAAGAATRLASSTDYSVLHTDANGYPAWTQTLGAESAPLTAGYFTTLNASTSKITTLTIDLISPGRLLVATSTAPDYSYQYDTDTGLGWISDNKQALYTGGTARLTVDSSGNVGIGTTSPDFQLELESTAPTLSLKNTGATNSRIISDTNPTVTSSTLSRYFTNWNGKTVTEIRSLAGTDTTNKDDGVMTFFTSAADDLTERMRITSGGNVGIGTTGPGAKLDIMGNEGGGGAFNNNLYIRNDSVTGDPVQFQIGFALATADISNPRGTLSLQSNGSTGNVGIGTTGPRAVLDVTGDIIQDWTTGRFIGVQYLTGSSYRFGLSFTLATNALNIDAKDADVVPTRPNIQFRTGATPSTVMTIQQNGNVGIGTTSPFALLSVAGSGFFNSSLTASNITATGTLTVQSTTATSTFSTGGLTVGTSQFVVQQSSGNVGIGTTSPGSLLSLNNIANFTTATSTFYGNGINLEDGCFAINGTCVGGGGGSGLTSLNGETGATQTFATSSTASTNFTITSSGNVHTLNIPPASETANGLITTGIQTIGGSKIFSPGSISFDMISTGFRIGLAATSQSNLTLGGSSLTNSLAGVQVAGSLNIAARAWVNPNALTIGANNAYISYVFGNTGAITEASSGNHPLFSQLALKPLKITAGVATVSDTASLYIEGAATTTVVSGQNYALWVNDVGGGGISRIDGKLMVGATSTSPFTLAVQGSALADDWLTYSPMSDKADALSEIKNIKCETGTSVNGWCNVDHTSLPSGVRVQAPYTVKNIVGYKPPVEVENWDEEKKATTTSMWSEPIQEEKEVMGDYMSMTKLTAMLVQSTQELDVRVSALETSQLGGLLNSQGEYVSEAIKQEIDNRIDAKKDEIKDYVIETIQEMSLSEKIKLLF